MTQLSDLVTPAVMGRVVAYRKQRKMSAAKLADACTAAGHPISRAVLAGLENGRRASVGVDDLLAFAHVLDVPVLELLYGIDALNQPSPLALPIGANKTQAELLLHADGTWGGESTTLTSLRELVTHEAGMVTVYESLGAAHVPRDPATALAHRELVRTTLRQVAAPTAQSRWSLLMAQASAPPMDPEVRRVYETAGFHDVLDVFARAEASGDPGEWIPAYEAAMDAVWDRRDGEG